MIRKTIKEIATMIDIQNDVSKFADISIHGATFNTLTLKKGNLFVPIQGGKRDGHEFVEQAFENGAAASLWQKDYPNPPKNVPLLFVEDTLEALQQLAAAYRNQLKVKVVGVTGSNGKTTTKDMLAELLSLKYKVQKTIGNYNNHIGLPLTILDLEEDTEVAVLEMGMSNFDEIDLLSKIAKPNAALITSIGEAHLKELGSREGIARAKLEILNGLQEDGLFVYPGDEPLIKEKLSQLDHEKTKGWKILTFGKSGTNDFYPTSIKMDKTQSIFTTNKLSTPFQMPVLGEYNVLNALGAMLVAHHFGVPFEQMNKAFKRLKITGMRMELIEGKNGSSILNDAYNASPTSMKAVIDLVMNLTGFNKKILVLGDMLELGPDEQKFHEEIGHYIDPTKIQMVYTYGNLSKHITKITSEKLGAQNSLSFDNKEELVDHLLKILADETLVVVKASRGMKLEEVVDRIKKTAVIE